MLFASVVFFMVFGNFLIVVGGWHFFDRVIRKAYCKHRNLPYKPIDF